MSKEIKTPEYWKEERFQPLVEAKTINGNKVMIPKIMMTSWKSWEHLGKEWLQIPEVKEKLERGCQNPESERRKIGYDLGRLFFEIGPEE